jgi:uncharacterized protein with HEPN domain
MESDLATVLDIVLAGRRIQSFLAGIDQSAFMTNEEKRWAVVSQLTIIGEAVRRLSDAFQGERPSIPWRQIAGTRDRLIHGYDKISWSLVWTTASEDIPLLLTKLEPLVSPDESASA